MLVNVLETIQREISVCVLVSERETVGANLQDMVGYIEQNGVTGEISCV